MVILNTYLIIKNNTIIKINKIIKIELNFFIFIQLDRDRTKT